MAAVRFHTAPKRAVGDPTQHAQHPKGWSLSSLKTNTQPRNRLTTYSELQAVAISRRACDPGGPPVPAVRVRMPVGKPRGERTLGRRSREHRRAFHPASELAVCKVP